MKIINYKLVQFFLVFCMGIVIGYLVDREGNAPVLVVTDSEQKTENIDDPFAVTGQQYQSSSEIEVNELRERVSMLEQQLMEQQQADSLISENNSQDDSRQPA